MVSNQIRPLKKAHLFRCAQSPRSNVLPKYASARRFLARLASEIFLTSLQAPFFNNLLVHGVSHICDLTTAAPSPALTAVNQA